MPGYQSRNPSTKFKNRSHPNKLTIQLTVSLILCMLAAGCRYRYPAAVDTVTQIVFGQYNGRAHHVFSDFSQTLSDFGAMEAVSYLYDELWDLAKN